MEKMLEKLTKREKTMLGALVVIGIVAAVFFLLVTPLNRTLEQRRATLESETSHVYEMEAQIARADELRKQLVEAEAGFETAKGELMNMLKPEDLDTLITRLITDSGFAPESLTLSQLGSESVAVYTGVTVTGAAASGDATDGADGTGMIPGAGDASAEAWLYSVNVTANGTMDNFYALLDGIGAYKGLYLVSYTLPDTGEESASFSLSFKCYVYNENAYSSVVAQAEVSDHVGGDDAGDGTAEDAGDGGTI